MNSKAVVIIGTAHLQTTPGKCSPDGRFKEYAYSREICKLVKEKLAKLGYNVFIDYEDSMPNAAMKAPTFKQQQSKELSWRVKYVNNLCAKYGTANCMYVSIHVNAAGADGKWKTAGGWSVFTSPGKTKADDLATCLYNAANAELSEYFKLFVANKAKGIYDSKQRPMRSDFSDGDPDYESRLYVCTQTKCPAALTENLFQDNKADVDFLLSTEGKRAIVDLHVNGIIEYIRKYVK